MFMYTRKIGEALVTPNGVKITVLAIRGNQVEFALDHPNPDRVSADEIDAAIAQLFASMETEFEET